MFNFENQEPPPSHGRGNRQSVPTPGMIAFAEEQAKLTASRERRQAKKALQTAMPPTPPPSVGRAPLRDIVPPNTVIQPPLAAAATASQGHGAEGMNFFNMFPQYANGEPGILADSQPAPGQVADTFSDTIFRGPFEYNDMGGLPANEVPEATTADEPEEGVLVGQLASNVSNRIVSQPLTTSEPLQRRGGNTAGNTASPTARPFVGSPVTTAMPYVRKNLIDPIISLVPSKRTHDQVEEEPNTESPNTSRVADDPEVQANLRRATMNPQRRRIFDLAVTKFRVKLLFTNAFPDSITTMKFASEAWYQAFNSLQITLNYQGFTNPTDEELELIKARSSQFRGQVVTVARNATGPFFGLQKATDQAVINANRETVSKLLNRLSFVYQNPDNRDEPGTLFRSALIPLVLNVSCFNKKEHSEGLHGGTTSNFITLPAIALAVTTINCALDEWKTGIKVDGQFSAKIYEATYQKHLKYLKDWEEYSATRSRATDALRNNLYHQALEHAGVFEQTLPEDGGNSELTVADFAANEA
ncbi:hypothetical protein ONZ45_g3895 [Pleurotus djamor]|nr:hypothetical protein ONZ45_g3895 [Pleurotus djamor]